MRRHGGREYNKGPGRAHRGQHSDLANSSCVYHSYAAASDKSAESGKPLNKYSQILTQNKQSGAAQAMCG
jgi:hypothetical protein